MVQHICFYFYTKNHAKQSFILFHMVYFCPYKIYLLYKLIQHFHAKILPLLFTTLYVPPLYFKFPVYPPGNFSAGYRIPVVSIFYKCCLVEIHGSIIYVPPSSIKFTQGICKAYTSVFNIPPYTIVFAKSVCTQSLPYHHLHRMFRCIYTGLLI